MFKMVDDQLVCAQWLTIQKLSGDEKFEDLCLGDNEYAQNMVL